MHITLDLNQITDNSSIIATIVKPWTLYIIHAVQKFKVVWNVDKLVWGNLIADSSVNIVII